MKRKILHIDMDAFFAAVETLDNPNLKGKPIIVGGNSERGVVTTCSYEARKYGVRSAMPGYIAKSLCPNAIFVPIRHYRYREISKKVFDIIHRFAEVVEVVSIDEAYIDITDKEVEAIKIAFLIKQTIKKELGLTLSVGISYNKFLAKLASDWNKPNGIMEITKENVENLLAPLEISKIHGIGQKSVEKLNSIGIFTVADMYSMPQELFTSFFGKYGTEIYKRIRGIDTREVITTRERKSVGSEKTFKKDTKDKKILNEYLHEISKKIEYDLNKNNLVGKTLTVKIKNIDFETHTKSKTYNYSFEHKEEIYEESKKILNDLSLTKEIRLIGITISSVEKKTEKQISLFE